jgi:hypothetical protein
MRIIKKAAQYAALVTLTVLLLPVVVAASLILTGKTGF